MTEQRLDSPDYDWKTEHFGEIRITSIGAGGWAT